MQITILGSGTCVPSPERSSPCIGVVSGTTTVVFDTGPGSLRQMAKAGIELNDIDVLCYTHLHIDHTADFAPLLFASKYQPNARSRDISILAAPGFRDFYANLTKVYGSWIIPEKFSINWCNSGGPCVFGPLTITSAQVRHTPHSIAFRVHDANGKSMVYSGDTDYCESIVELAHGCDVLILECSFPDDRYCQGHLTPKLAGRIAAEADCSQLLLTHFYPPCDPEHRCSVVSKHSGRTPLAAYDFLKINI